MNVDEYAKKILADSGCDEYAYGGPDSVHIMEDLKEAFPEGMDHPYIDVANAILAMSRPRPISRAPWRVIWDTDRCCDGMDAESFEAAKCAAEDILIGWAMEEIHGWKCQEPTPEEKESWDYMIYNCFVHVSRYDPARDEYDEYWSPDDEELKRIGWVPFKTD